MPRRLAGPLVLLLMGVALVGGGTVGMQQAGSGDTVLTVSAPLPESEVPDTADVVEYGNLSPVMQRAVAAAVDDDDRRYRFAERTPATVPPASVVRYRGDYYRFGVEYGTNTGGEYVVWIWGGVAMIVGALGWWFTQDR